MKSRLCKWLGHKWKPAYIRGHYNLYTEIKFIGVYCKRCFKGYDELIDATAKMTSSKYKTYSENYFDNDTYSLEVNDRGERYK